MRAGKSREKGREREKIPEKPVLVSYIRNISLVKFKRP